MALTDSLVIPFLKGDKYGIATPDRKLLTKFIYDEVSTYVFDLGNTASVKRDGKAGAVNAEGREIVPCENDWVIFRENFGVIKKGKQFSFVDLEGKELFGRKFSDAGSFSGGLAVVKEKNKYGAIDTTGQVVIPFQFGSDFYFWRGVAIVKSKSKVYLIDRDGQRLCPDYTHIEGFNEGGFSLCQQGRLFGIINTAGQEVVKCQFKEPAFPDEMGWAVVKENKTEAFATPGGLIFEGKLLSIYPYSEGLAAVKTDKGWGFINRNGNFVIGPGYRWVSSFSEGLATACDANENCGVINAEGKTVIDFKYSSIREFEGGLSVYCKTEGDKEVKGILNTKGEEVPVPDNEFVEGFSCGVALLKNKNHDWAFINKDGEIITRWFDRAVSMKSPEGFPALGYSPVKIHLNDELDTFADSNGNEFYEK
jgi:hypothetical protein